VKRSSAYVGSGSAYLLFVALFMPLRASGQQIEQRFQGEARLDGIFARSTAVEAGYGLSIPAGLYVRNGIIGGAGVGRHGADGRLDFVSRFSFDPFRQSRWAPYAGAGFSTRFRSARDGGTRGFLLAYLGIDGPLALGARTGWAPALEVGFGGGTRVGVILRRAIASRR
jgi:hypothetical protein